MFLFWTSGFFMRRWSSLFQRGAVSTITVEAGTTSFAQSSGKLIKLIQVRRLWCGNTLEFKKKGQLNTSLLGLYSCQITFRYFTENTLYVSSHLHWILSSSLAPPVLDSLFLVLKPLSLLKLWGCRVSPCVVSLPQLGDPGSSSHLQTWMIYDSKGLGVYLGAFERGGRGQDAAIWKYGAINSPMSEYWPMFYSSLEDWFKV